MIISRSPHSFVQSALRNLTSLFSYKYTYSLNGDMYNSKYIYIYVCIDIFIEVRTSWRVRRNKHHTAIILINYHWSDNMLFATDLTNERTLYLITRLTPRAHPRPDPPRIILASNVSLLLLSIFSFLTLSFFSPSLFSLFLPYFIPRKKLIRLFVIENISRLSKQLLFF